MQQPYAPYRDTPLWHALASTLADLESSGEVRMNTAPDYVIGFICQELAAKWIVTPRAMAPVQ